MLTAKEAYERSREIREKSYNECFKMISDNISICHYLQRSRYNQ